jgi:hypothetical protein
MFTQRLLDISVRLSMPTDFLIGCDLCTGRTLELIELGAL